MSIENFEDIKNKLKNDAKFKRHFVSIVDAAAKERGITRSEFPKSPENRDKMIQMGKELNRVLNRLHSPHNEENQIQSIRDEFTSLDSTEERNEQNFKKETIKNISNYMKKINAQRHNLDLEEPKQLQNKENNQPTKEKKAVKLNSLSVRRRNGQP